MTDQRFHLTDEHLKLLRRMNVGWQGAEFGAPEIDPKRPYGNSDVFRDLAEILQGQPPSPDDDEDLSDEERTRLDTIHRETETALQVVLATGAFEPGVYVAPPYTRRWRREEGV